MNLDGCYATRLPEVLAKERRSRKRPHRHHLQHNHYPHFYRPSQDLSPGSEPERADLNLDLHLVVVPPSPLAQPAQPARPLSPRQKPDSLLLQSRSTPEYLTAALTPPGDSRGTPDRPAVGVENICVPPPARSPARQSRPVHTCVSLCKDI